MRSIYCRTLSENSSCPPQNHKGDLFLKQLKTKKSVLIYLSNSESNPLIPKVNTSSQKSLKHLLPPLDRILELPRRLKRANTKSFNIINMLRKSAKLELNN